MSTIAARTVACGRICISNARSIVRGDMNNGVFLSFSVVICELQRGDDPSLFHAECVNLGVSQQGLSVDDAFTALADTLESVCINNGFNVDRIQKMHMTSCYEMHQCYRAASAKWKPYIDRRFV